MWNTSLNALYIKEIRPECSMVKFVCPFLSFELPDIDTFVGKEELEAMRDKYDTDYVKDHAEGKFRFFQSDDIYVQPWAPSASSEARLFVKLENIDKPFVNYDHTEWERKFAFISSIRSFGYFPKYKDIVDTSYYDRSYDSVRELDILFSYIGEQDTDRLKELRKLIDKYTFYSLSGENLKCKRRIINSLVDESTIDENISKLMNKSHKSLNY